MYRVNVNSDILFYGEPLSGEFETRKNRILSSIESETDDYILNVNETEYIEHLLNVNSFCEPNIRFDAVCVEDTEEDIPIEKFPNHFLYGECPKFIRRQVVKYQIPCEGDINLLYSRPSTIICSMTSNIKLLRNNIVIDIINFNDDVNAIQVGYNNAIQKLKQMCSYLHNDIENYNSQLVEFTTVSFRKRKQTILNKHNILASLGVPIKKSANVATTFSIPRPATRKIVLSKPVVMETGYKPEPTIDLECYNDILKIINDVGKNFERLPSVYAYKNEEDLRDHILLVLDPNFSNGSASGETFNKRGKTDIQLRYDSSVVFIAECKFWKGEKVFMKTIDQLFSYLTWRDSKAAIIFFVTQRGFSDVISKVKTAIANHNNYLGYIDSPDESWLNYRFHVNGDRNREVRLAIQLFHIPTV